MITVSKEDYLKAILEAQSEGQTVISATLAHWLAVSAPAVTMALRRLKRDSLVQVGADGVVQLTSKGKEIAQHTMLRHYLVERMLAEMFGMEWYRVHDEAERLEHAISPEFEARLLKKLGSRGSCPHGNPILPESPTARRRRGLRLLSEAEPGPQWTIACFFERDRKLLEFLHSHGLAPGGKIRLISVNYDETVTIEAAGKRVSLGRPAAEKVWVAPAKSHRT